MHAADWTCHLDDNRDRKVDIVRVDEADSEACEAGKGAMHRALTQNLHR